MSQLKSKKVLKIVITTHHKPDADALGSSLALWHFLKKIGHNVVIVSPTDYPPYLCWMPGEHEVINFEENTEKAIELCENADLIFCLDFNDLSRINKFGEYVGKSKALKIMIDHHRNPAGFDDYRFWTIETSSTSELIYDFIQKCQSNHLIDKDIASCLYAGIMADTGSFRFSSTSSKTHRIAAELIDLGVESAKIQALLLDNFSLSRYRLMGYVLYKKLHTFPKLKTALVYLSQEELQRFNIQTGDTEGFVNYGLGIKGIVFSALIVDRTEMIKMSFRSQGSFPCNEFAEKYFNGGGHLNASGGWSKDTLNEVVSKFKEVLPEYRNQLLSSLDE
ncbi:MAG: bifunctional oligoribonuclease/PAP phosphatase NrnA [Flavobacteriales bacterium]|nr:bifunctional oligoribonuclease/PAP phosphatase NrnA [Flavobacteriales bacterium]